MKTKKNNTFCKITNLILYTIVFCILCISVLSFLEPITSKFNFGIRAFNILSGSMEPNISPGDMILVRHIKPKNIKVDDIITFKVDNNYVTHRVIKVNDSNFITKGDNNNTEDLSPVPFEKVVGKSLLLLPYLGYVSMWFKNPIVFFSLLTILLFVLFYDGLLKFNKKKTTGNL